jgi:copper(I)-binding protein
MKKTFQALCVVGAMAATPLAAHHAGEVVVQGDIAAGHGWAYENTEMAHAVEVYFTVTNTGDEPDRLIASSVDFADRTEIQAQVLGEDGVLKTRSIDAVEVAPGQTLTFQPGGMRLVLMSVQRQFDHGQQFDLSLAFERAGTLEIDILIEEVDHDDEDEAEPSS